MGTTGGDQTLRIRADVAANKIAKPKKAGGPFKLPLIGNRTVEQQLPILLAIAGVFLVLTIVAIVYDGVTRGYLSTYTNITSQLQFHTQRLAKAAGLAARGDAASFPQLQDAAMIPALSRQSQHRRRGVRQQRASARISEELTSRLDRADKRYADTSKRATAILAAKNDLIDLSRNIAQVRALSEDLAALSQDLTGILQQANVSPAQVLKANRLTFLAEAHGRSRLGNSRRRHHRPEVPFLMGKDTNDFSELVKALEAGSEALGINAVRDGDGKAKVAKLREQFSAFEKNIVRSWAMCRTGVGAPSGAHCNRARNNCWAR